MLLYARKWKFDERVKKQRIPAGEDRRTVKRVD
jgi:hypothetical protein